MKALRIPLTLAAVALLASPLVATRAAAQAAGGGKPTVAVLYFNNNALGKANGELAPLSKGTADMLITELAANPNLRVVERDQIQSLLAEQKLSQDGKLDQETAIKVGKILGAHHMVTGGFTTDPAGGKTLRFDFRVFNTETSALEFADRVQGKTDDFMTLVTQVADKISKGAKLPDLPKRVGEARQEQAKKVPYEAVMLYSRGLAAKDAGKKGEAVTLFNQALAKFPEFDKAKSELSKLQ